MTENTVEVSENSLAILVSEAEMTLEAIDELPDNERERISDAIDEALEAMS